MDLNAYFILASSANLINELNLMRNLHDLRIKFIFCLLYFLLAGGLADLMMRPASSTFIFYK